MNKWPPEEFIPTACPMIAYKSLPLSKKRTYLCRCGWNIETHTAGDAWPAIYYHLDLKLKDGWLIAMNYNDVFRHILRQAT